MIIIYATTKQGISHLSRKVSSVHRGEAEVDIKLPSGIDVMCQAWEWDKWCLPWYDGDYSGG